jgi:hypothetical protein
MSLARLSCVVIALTIFSVALVAQDAATVTAEIAQLHSQASATSKVVGSLERGRRVIVDWMISDSRVDWCLVRDPDQEPTLGYVSCNELTREGLPKISTATLSSSATSSSWSDSGGSSTGIEQAAINRWSSQLGLTETQRREVFKLLDSSGIVGARLELIKTMRSYGVTDRPSLVRRLQQYAKDPQNDSFIPVVDPMVQSGGAQYKAFWSGFWNVLTPAQRERASTVQSFLVAYLESQSYPEGAFAASALLPTGYRNKR